MTPAQKVVRAARKAASARQQMEAAIREARAAGLPLRTVAEAAGVSYETVRRIAGGASHHAFSGGSGRSAHHGLDATSYGGHFRDQPRTT